MAGKVNGWKLALGILGTAIGGVIVADAAGAFKRESDTKTKIVEGTIGAATILKGLDDIVSATTENSAATKTTCVLSKLGPCGVGIAKAATTGDLLALSACPEALTGVAGCFDGSELA